MILKGHSRMNVISRQFEALGERASTAAEIIKAALDAANPAIAVSESLQKLQGDKGFAVIPRIGLVSIGKAAIPMAMAAKEVLGERITNGIVVSKSIPEGSVDTLQGFRLMQGNHPVPGELSLRAGGEVMQFVTVSNGIDGFLFLISGGASALVTLPADGVDLSDLMKTTNLLLDCGASIDEINAVRKHLDEIKGGGLTAKAAPLPCYSLILSDVLGNRLDVIASGPTVPDPSTFADALKTLKKYELSTSVPSSVLARLTTGKKGSTPETPKPGDAIFSKNQSLIVGSLERSMLAAEKAAIRAGYGTELLSPLIIGEASQQGRRLGEFLKQKAAARKPGDQPLCWIGGGETTVTLGVQNHGSGGRNLELALAAVNSLAGLHGAALITFATDGEDGQSPAAGAVVTGATRQQATEHGMDPDEYLINHDSYSFFHALDAAIITGSTGTNVNDLVILLLD
jgi:glycerate 2-kinase